MTFRKFEVSKNRSCLIWFLYVLFYYWESNEIIQANLVILLIMILVFIV